MIDTILFDLDGTLVQHGYVLLPQKLGEWGHARSPKLVERAFLKQIQWVYELAPTLLDGTTSSPEATERAWADLWHQVCHRVVRDLSIEQHGVAERLVAYFEEEPTPPLFEDVLPLLDELSGNRWKLGIITQRDRRATERFLRDHNVRERFGVIIAGDDGHGRKPQPAPFRRALAQLDSRAEQAVFVGDRVDDDCGGACAANVAAFLIDRTASRRRTPTRGEPAFVHLRSLLALPAHLARQREATP